MSEGPIVDIKQQLQSLQSNCDALQEAINTSNQAQASQKLISLIAKIDTIKQSLHKEFGWLLPQE